MGCHNLIFLLSMRSSHLTLFHSKFHSNGIGHQLCAILNCKKNITAKAEIVAKVELPKLELRVAT